MTKVLLFDFDGVIADTLDYFLESFLDSCAEHGHHHINDKQTFLNLFDSNLYEAMEAAGITAGEIPSVMQGMKDRLIHRGLSYTHYPEIPEILHQLAEKHTLYIITSNHSQPVHEFLAQHDITCFAGVLGSDHHTSKIAKIEQVNAAHPDAELFYIGDTKGDMLEGRAARVKTVAATWGWHPHGKLVEAAPDHIAHKPTDLLEIFPCK